MSLPSLLCHGKRVVVIVLCVACLTACATLGTIPGVSLAVDALSVYEMYKGLQNDDLQEDKLREMESRPTPAPPGLSYDVGVARKGFIAYIRGNHPLVIEMSRNMQRHGTDPGLISMMMGAEAAAEAANGRFQAASRVLREREKRWQTNPKASGILRMDDGDFRAVEIGAQTQFALEAAQYDEVERLLRTYESQPPAIREGRQLWFRIHMLAKRGGLLAGQGNGRAGYDVVRDALRLHRSSFGGSKKLAGSTPEIEAEQEQWLLWDLIRLSLENGALSQARDHLADLKRAVQAAGSRRYQVAQYHLLEATYFESLGLSTEAIASLDRSWAHSTAFMRNSPVTRMAYFLSRSRNQVAQGDVNGSLQTLQNLGSANAIEDSVQRDGMIRQLTVSEVLAGRDSSALGEMDRLDQRFQRRMGTHDALQHFAIKVIAYSARAAKRGDLADHAKAVEAGRFFSRSMRTILSFGGSLSNSPPQLLRMAKEAYLGAAASSAGRGGVTIDDLLDAMSLVQLSDTDADIAMAATRQKEIPGIRPEKLRQLQDLQQAARAKERLVAEYARSNDHDAAKMEELSRQASAATEQLAKTLASLEAVAPSLFQALSTSPPSVRAIQARLSLGEAVLAVAPAGDRTVALLISRQNVAHSSLPLGPSETKDLVKRVRDSVTFNDAVQVPAFDIEASKALYGKLLGWTTRSLVSVKSLTVVANGSLGSVPFGLLLEPIAGGSDYRTMPWLIKSMAVTHMPSIASWHAIASSAGPVRSSFIAWADPDFSGRAEAAPGSATRAVRKAVRAPEQRGLEVQPGQLPANLGAMLPALPETKAEAQAVARALRASVQRDVVVGAQATRSSVIAASESGALAQKGVVMFATHGLAPAQVPGLFQPALAMAREPGSNQPSLLQLDDVMGLRMNADWVLLSACNTASADRAGGDAMSGLARGFFFAGARSLLVTHWEVESESAAAITTKTMERYATNPRLTRAQALQETSIELIDAKRTPQDWAHPAFWAAYALVGDGRRPTTGAR